MKTTLLAVLAFTLAGAALTQTPPAAAPAKHKVVFQMNVADNDSWNQLFGNIGNAQKAFQKDCIQIEVVFYGKGITALLKTNTEFEERLKKAAAEGVPVYGVKDDRNAARAWLAYEAAGKEITRG